MKSLDECNYYELLDVAPDAPKSAVEEAYRNAVELFGADSVVSYSFLSDPEREELLERLAAAYRTLSHDARRREYDRRVLGRVVRRSVPAAPPPHTPPGPAPAPEGTAPPPRAFLDQGGRVRLDRLREARGVSLEALSEATRIRLPVLRALEQRDLGRLPPAVYVKGYLRACAAFLGVDAQELIRGYGPPVSSP